MQNAIPVPKEDADKAMDAADLYWLWSCVATCKNGSAMLFVGAESFSVCSFTTR